MEWGEIRCWQGASQEKAGAMTVRSRFFFLDPGDTEARNEERIRGIERKRDK